MLQKVLENGEYKSLILVGTEVGTEIHVLIEADLRALWNLRLHPLIYILPGLDQAQNVDKKAEQRTPHLLNQYQDIVAGPQKEKCGLKYVI